MGVSWQCRPPIEDVGKWNCLISADCSNPMDAVGCAVQILQSLSHERSVDTVSCTVAWALPGGLWSIRPTP